MDHLDKGIGQLRVVNVEPAPERLLRVSVTCRPHGGFREIGASWKMG